MPYADSTIDELVESAIANRSQIDANVLRSTLETVDYNAVRSLLVELRQLTEARKIDPFFCDEIVYIIVDGAVKQECETRYNLLALLTEMPITGAASAAIHELGRLGNPKALTLFRNILSHTKHPLQQYAARGIVVAQYAEPVPALQDESDLVRYEAVSLLRPDETIKALQDRSERVRHAAAQKLEKENNATGLIEALRDGSPLVRRVAAWYMGRKRVEEAAHPLIGLVQVEDDTETLRAAIWSLGVLRDAAAVPYLQQLSQHSVPVIVATVQDALSKFDFTSGEQMTK